MDTLRTAGADSGAGSSIAAGAGLASGEASGNAVSAIALKPVTAIERAKKEVNNFFIVLTIKCV